ncbi:M20/M25/M40 family metallo-hydrolase [Pseudogracilibacillus sp. SO30301A]|uniref:M20/M25/M40 family metallo-hydrolase n=1 Tax=Pseudogracilibacillus sp. SO30301A TaxID=3098291 RepID=UPI00300E1F21
MKNWNQLFVRHGWNLEQMEEFKFQCKNETADNMEFLLECFDRINVHYHFEGEELEIVSSPVSEREWIKAVDFEFRGRTENIGLSKDCNGPGVSELDTYISGVVRQLNRLGFYTIVSCDGHGRRGAYVYVTKNLDVKSLVTVLLAVGMRRVYYREFANHYKITLSIGNARLLDLAESLSKVEVDWLKEEIAFIKEQLFYKSLHEVLSIPGVSGSEGRIRSFVKEKLAPFVDFVTVDRSGNLLAEKTYRGGNGPTILLNAHLDVATELAPGRSIIKENGIWRSTEGILGADDRAGVAVLLHIAEKLIDSTFRGKVKYIFTVEEECGLVGASKVDDYFLWGTDAAFVIDRRGTGDIVTSCWGSHPFCDVNFGKLIEQIADESGLVKWKCTSGGSSDTRIWAEHGIQSVNLSTGYRNEHTDDEFLDVAACYNVTKLLTAIFDRANEVRRVVRRISFNRNILNDMNEEIK